MTSTHGVRRHTGVRNLLSGAAAVLTSVLQRPQLPRPSVGRSLIGPLLAVWRHTGVRFLLSGAAAVQTSVLQQLQLPRPSVGRSLIGLLLAVWRHTRVRFLACLASAMLTSVPQRLQPARPSVGRLLTRSFFFLRMWMDKGSMHRPRACCCAVHAAAAAQPCALTPRRPAELRPRCSGLRGPAVSSIRGNQLVWRGYCLHSSCPLSKTQTVRMITKAGVSRAGART